MATTGNILRSRTGSLMPILFAVGFVIFLGFCGGAINYFQALKIKQTRRTMAKKQGFLGSEIMAWHTRQVFKNGLETFGTDSGGGRIIASADIARYANSAEIDPIGTCTTTPAGTPANLACTSQFDSATSVLQRVSSENYKFQRSVAVAGAQNYCGNVDFSRGKFSIRACLTEPQSVYPLSFLDSTGRSIQIEWDVAATEFKLFNVISTENPRFDSMKNVPTSPVLYEFLNTYAIDVAIGDNANEFVLTADGRIVRRVGSVDTVIYTDPKITSISFVNDTWYYLRSDGAVFQGTNNFAEAGDSTKFKEITGLRIPTAKALTMGLGHTNYTF